MRFRRRQLIDDLLDTSRLITGNLRLELSPTELVPLITSAIDVIRPAAGAKEISISTQFCDSDISITCDPFRLQQMVSNLLANAVKFTPRSGSIDVKLDCIGNILQIAVVDSGQGISPDFLPFIFDRFRQADSQAHARKTAWASASRSFVTSPNSTAATYPSTAKASARVPGSPFTSRVDRSEPTGGDALSAPAATAAADA